MLRAAKPTLALRRLGKVVVCSTQGTVFSHQFNGGRRNRSSYSPPSLKGRRQTSIHDIEGAIGGLEAEALQSVVSPSTILFPEENARKEVPQPAWASARTYVARHVGPNVRQIMDMLSLLSLSSVEQLIDQVVPADIRTSTPLQTGNSSSESEALSELREIAALNQETKSLLGMGYHGTTTPAVVQQRILEDPAWYTPYTPYQAEISQGRLEMLLNFQTMVTELTGTDIANASLLDEGTAVAEALNMCRSAVPASQKKSRQTYVVIDSVHPQTLGVVRTRTLHTGMKVVVLAHENEVTDELLQESAAVLLSYPTSEGKVENHAEFVQRVHAHGSKVVVSTDLLALTVLTPPGHWGADVVVGSAQRFGVPMMYGGPHAGFIGASKAMTRLMPGRMVGVTQDVLGNRALRLALQTRENHIRREKATSNVCTAQALLANVAAAYAIFHGPEGLQNIAKRVAGMAQLFALGAQRLNFKVVHENFFDTVVLQTRSKSEADRTMAAAMDRGFNLRRLSEDRVAASMDETITVGEVRVLLEGMGEAVNACADFNAALASMQLELPAGLTRQTPCLTSSVFSSCNSEQEFVRYTESLARKDLGLIHSMIPLGSCTMKLNSAPAMETIGWSAFQNLHPFAPKDQAAGFHKVIQDLQAWLGDITGLPHVSLQPNAGSAGEYAGLLAIRACHESRGQGDRNVVLIPRSAHGTNPASAVMAGLKVVAVESSENGDISVSNLKELVKEHGPNLAAIMVTYPSTHGVFEQRIKEICNLVHSAGGMVYLDGANMNAQMGLCRPGEYGADVCHLNLHKTFSIPHGGGGPGVGPIACTAELAPFLPSNSVVPADSMPRDADISVSSAPWGSAGVLPISWMFMKLLGGEGLKQSSQIAILNANYMSERLKDHFNILFRGDGGRCAHEFILDMRPIKEETGISETDVAKRLMDYGFHAPTMSWPIPGTLMFEPTESESKEEMDRLCDALIQIKAEINEVAEGKASKTANVLKGAPHSLEQIASSTWDREYSREAAAFPLPWVAARKVWPAVGRVDDAFGDKNFICTCPSVDDVTASQD